MIHEFKLSYQSGKASYELGAEFNCSKATIVKLLKIASASEETSALDSVVVSSSSAGAELWLLHPVKIKSVAIAMHKKGSSFVREKLQLLISF